MEDDHRHKIQECVTLNLGLKNSKVLSKDKHDLIVTALKDEADSKLSAKDKWTLKKKNYSLVNFPELNLTDVLCVPSKTKNENDTTLLSTWRIQAHSGNIADILIRLHWKESNHVGYKKLLAKVQSRYEGIPRSIIQEASRTCSVCLLSVRQTNKAELKPILSSGFLTRAQIDLIDMRHKPDGEYNYIAHYMDHWSKYHVIWPLKRKTADEVAAGLNERVFPYLGLPRILHSDNGREFVNKVVRGLLQDWGSDNDVLFINGRPRHSQSQGLVEQGNATIERHIANKRATLNLTEDRSYPWASWLPKIMFSMNTEVAEGIKKLPYEVVFGQPPRNNIFPEARAEGGIINEEDLNLDAVVSDKEDEEPSPEENSPAVSTTNYDSGGVTSNNDSRGVSEPGYTPSPLRPINTDLVSESKQVTENIHCQNTPINYTPSDARKMPTPLPRSSTNSRGVLELGHTTTPLRPINTNVSRETKQVTENIKDRQTSMNSTPSDARKTPTPLPRSVNRPPSLVSTRPTPKPRRKIMFEKSGSTSTPATSEGAHCVNLSNLDEEVCGIRLTVKPTTSQSEAPSKHEKVRLETEVFYRKNAEKMKLKYSKGKRIMTVDFKNGDLATVRIPKIDRSCTDQPRMIVKVIDIKGDKDKLFKLQCKHGILDGWYRVGELMPFESTYNYEFTCTNRVGLREAARRENPNLVSRKKCMCKKGCKDNCHCRKQNLKCSSHCHPSKTCNNVETIDIRIGDRQEILKGKELTDKHMNAVQTLLRRQFEINEGFKDTLTVHSLSHVSVPYVQIFHINGNHWIVVAGNPDCIEVYDSLTSGRLASDTLKLLRTFHGSNVPVKIMNIHQQKGVKDCGLFAVANATALCIGDDPTSLVYNQDEMRDHLLSCLETETMAVFPHSVVRCRKKVKSVL